MESEKWLRPSGEMFRRARLHETEITESLIAAARRAAAHAPRESLSGRAQRRLHGRDRLAVDSDDAFQSLEASRCPLVKK